MKKNINLNEIRIYKLKIESRSCKTLVVKNFFSYKEAKKEYIKQVNKLQELHTMSEKDYQEHQQYTEIVDICLFDDTNSYFISLFALESFVLTKSNINKYIESR